MTITRINRIKDHRIFQDFAWPNGLQDFARFNLIFGWNGSGKTTLANLFRAVEKRLSVSEGEFELSVDGNSCSASSFDTNPALPRVRVFNRDYVDASVFKADGEPVEAIYVLGEGSAQKQKEIERLRKELGEARDKITIARQALDGAEGALEGFRKERALSIKNILGNDAESAYRNYHKGHFQEAADARLNDASSPSNVLGEDERDGLILRQQEKPKAKVLGVTVELHELNGLRDKANALLGTTVVAQTIQRLIDYPEIATWVEHGLKYHPIGVNTCEFCGEAFSEARLTALEGHFNDQLKAHTASLEAILSDINGDKNTLERLRTPAPAELYADLAVGYSKAEQQLKDAVSAHMSVLIELAKSVSEKRAKPFERFSNIEALNTTNGSDVSRTLGALNDVIVKHNRETDEFADRIAQARIALEAHFVAEILDDYKGRVQAVTDKRGDYDGGNTTIRNLETAIALLDKELSEHIRPAEELTRELWSYLGRNELTFKVEGHGYTITRHGLPAKHLSEGEKTAIAFLHFLKCLESDAGKGAFDLKNDVVVVDDPVSSLDANALFCAFAFMKERTKDAGQLFVLTHSFTFFSLVRKWFGFLKKPTRGFYMLETRGLAGTRTAAIAQLDASLEKFHSEYHFLFYRIYVEAKNAAAPAELADLYAMPNIARRFLETFLAFRRPGLSSDPDHPKLDKKIYSVASDFDAVRKARILRFVQTFSHDNKITEEEHDLFLLGEAREVLRDVLDLVEAEDSEHYRGMLEALQVPPIVAVPASLTPITVGEV